jgi:MinD-like ATPase involved in chromosome partitioning or flagellar assembly
VSKLIAIHSFRGGTGKSNTTANLAALVALGGNRVGVIDTDIQSPGIHVIFGLEQSKVHFALNDYLWGNCKIHEAAYDVTPAHPAITDKSRIFLIPSSVKTGELARVLKDGYDVGLLNDGVRQLVKALNLDYLFIDTHPGVNEETLLSIAISDKFLLIMRPDNQDFQGTAVTVELAHRLEVNDIMLIVNKVPQGMDCAFLKDHLEATYRVPVIGMMPLNSEMAGLGSSGLFALRFPDHPLTHELNGIAARVIS